MTVACNAPENLSANLNSDYTVSLTWDAPIRTDPEHYNIYRSLDGTNFNKIGESTTESYTDTTTRRGYTYYYYVTAVCLDVEGNYTESDASNTVSIDVPSWDIDVSEGLDVGEDVSYHASLSVSLQDSVNIYEEILARNIYVKVEQEEELSVDEDFDTYLKYIETVGDYVNITEYNKASLVVKNIISEEGLSVSENVDYIQYFMYEESFTDNVNMEEESKTEIISFTVSIGEVLTTSENVVFEVYRLYEESFTDNIDMKEDVGAVVSRKVVDISEEIDVLSDLEHYVSYFVGYDDYVSIDDLAEVSKPTSHIINEEGLSVSENIIKDLFRRVGLYENIVVMEEFNGSINREKVENISSIETFWGCESTVGNVYIDVMIDYHSAPEYGKHVRWVIDDTAPIWDYVNSDGSNLRIQAFDEVNLEYGDIPFWIEEFDYVGKSAVIWLYFDSDNYRRDSFRVLFNASSSLSNANATFYFYDDFNGTSLDTSKWNSFGDVSVSNGYVSIKQNGNGNGYIESISSFSVGTAMYLKMSFVHIDTFGRGVYLVRYDYGLGYLYMQCGSDYLSVFNNVYSDNSVSENESLEYETWYKFFVGAYEDRNGKKDIFIRDNVVKMRGSDYQADSNVIRFEAGRNFELRVDYVFVVDYIDGVFEASMFQYNLNKKKKVVCKGVESVRLKDGDFVKGTRKRLSEEIEVNDLVLYIITKGKSLYINRKNGICCEEFEKILFDYVMDKDVYVKFGDGSIKMANSKFVKDDTLIVVYNAEVEDDRKIIKGIKVGSFIYDGLNIEVEGGEVYFISLKYGLTCYEKVGGEYVE